MSFLDLKIKSLLNENNNKREEIRKIVRDVISVFKKNDEGNFYLPEDVNGEEFYDFDKIKAILTIELTIIIIVYNKYTKRCLKSIQIGLKR